MVVVQKVDNMTPAFIEFE